MTLTVIVDDIDPEIIYQGPWATVGSNSGFLNQSVGHSLHNSSAAIASGNAQALSKSQFTYIFTGKSKW